MKKKILLIGSVILISIITYTGCKKTDTGSVATSTTNSTPKTTGNVKAIIKIKTLSEIFASGNFGNGGQFCCADFNKGVTNISITLHGVNYNKTLTCNSSSTVDFGEILPGNYSIKCQASYSTKVGTVPCPDQSNTYNCGNGGGESVYPQALPNNGSFQIIANQDQTFTFENFDR